MNASVSYELGRNRHRLRLVAAIVCLPLTPLILAGCSHKGMAYPTADAAVESAVAALRVDDNTELTRILGSKADEAMSSGDEVADAQARVEFLERYDMSHELVPGPDGGSMILEVGDGGWPLPIPIVEDKDGWRFDTAAGMEEMLNRRIGRNELHTIETCRALNNAQAEYYLWNPASSPMLEYAGKFISAPGAFDGLYWPTGENEAPSPLGAIVAEAIDRGYAATGDGSPYYGYRYRMLTGQGEFAAGGSMSYLTDGRLTRGFAVVAYPERYGNSGVMTFIMNRHGIVYERDLGANTARKAAAMTEFDPDTGWMMVE